MSFSFTICKNFRLLKKFAWQTFNHLEYNTFAETKFYVREFFFQNVHCTDRIAPNSVWITTPSLTLSFHIIQTCTYHPQHPHYQNKGKSVLFPYSGWEAPMLPNISLYVRYLFVFCKRHQSHPFLKSQIFSN